MIILTADGVHDGLIYASFIIAEAGEINDFQQVEGATHYLIGWPRINAADQAPVYSVTTATGIPARDPFGDNDAVATRDRFEPLRAMPRMPRYIGWAVLAAFPMPELAQSALVLIQETMKNTLFYQMTRLNTMPDCERLVADLRQHTKPRPVQPGDNQREVDLVPVTP